MVRLRCHYFM